MEAPKNEYFSRAGKKCKMRSQLATRHLGGRHRYLLFLVFDHRSDFRGRSKKQTSKLALLTPSRELRSFLQEQACGER